MCRSWFRPDDCRVLLFEGLDFRLVHGHVPAALQRPNVLWRTHGMQGAMLHGACKH